MFIVKFSGGIGNQILQYAFGKFLMTLGAEVKFDKSVYENNEIHSGYQLDKLINEDISFVSDKDLPKYSLLSKVKNKFLYPLYRNTGIQLSWCYYKDKELLWKTHFNWNDFNIFLKGKLKGNMYFDGTWMDLKITNSIKGQKFKEPIVSSLNENYYSFVKEKVASDDVCAIHIRKGDFTNELYKQYYDVCDLTYYLNAGQKCNDDKCVLSYYVFTDDVEWVLRYIVPDFRKVGLDVHIVNENRKLSVLNELYLLSCSKNIIISNSTFSWVSAYFNGETTYVIAPDKWFKKSIKYKFVEEYSNLNVVNNFIPKEWMKLPIISDDYVQNINNSADL